MKEKFIKKYWPEDDIMFYIHFNDGIAVRQIEVSGNSSIFLSLDNPVINESMLYDQDISDLELNENDFISREEFENKWKS